MQHLPTADAASMLGLTPNALRACQQRFGFPTTHMHGNRRVFTQPEILRLQAAMRATHSIARAVTAARTHTGHTAATG